MDTLEGVSSLLDKSLLRQEEGPEGEPRFVMLETIHEYARERLEASSEAEDVRRLHAEYFLALAEAAEPELSGADQLACLERLEAEHDNFRAALSWSLEKAPETALRLAGALARDRKSTRLNSSHANISYAVFCLKKKSPRPTRSTRTRRPSDP